MKDERKIFMYCQKCGKEIAAGSVFCTWCGAKQESAVPQPGDIPQSSPIQENQVQESAATAAQQETSEPTAVMENPVESAAAAPETEPEAPQEAAADNTAGVAETAQEELPRDFFNDEIKLSDKAPEKAEKPRKYYTTAHLVICLAAAGIMAAAAGVFAGLYFSVIV